MSCLDNRETRSVSSAHGRHDIIMRRFHRMLEAAPDRALYLPKICDAINAPERHCVSAARNVLA